MNRKQIVFALTICLLNSCYQESRLLVNADFQAIIEDGNYTAPVKVKLTNNSTGADFYKWTFEGGTPSTSSDKTPSDITYSQIGTYKIVLEAWNGYERGEKEFTFTVDSAVTVSFDAEFRINDFAPAKVRIINRTEGASDFYWTFEGGIPETSADRNPGDVLFNKPGVHVISLVADNGREKFSLSKTIQLQDTIAVDFDVEASFDDFDYEIPFTANLVNKTTSGLTYEWTSTGGEITDKNAKNTSIHINTPGTYTVTLKGGNGNETKITSKKVTVKGNSNLYRMVNVKFGIKSAVDIVGSFYSLKNREIVTQNNVTESNGENINLVFFGINSSFEGCHFTSPDLARDAGFKLIPNATKTYFVNNIETSGLSFTRDNFDTMTNDSLLKSLDIKSASNTTSSFSAEQGFRIVLFEAADGRKGAIKVKAFVLEQINSSYILTDIKFQKTKAE
ncbi:hypothetical protein EZS27_017249 [termite gut metagenome]|uniref:PKD/Chitinase domain-containing protein n=1 Tax=termite gut metagenome TaxID=433724 RepID=A0A5J4RJS6_9ZZZZ